MSFTCHSQPVACKWEPCHGGTYLSVNRISSRRAADTACRTGVLHKACACPFIQLDGILNPAEQCMSFCRRKCCMQGMVTALLKPSSKDAWQQLLQTDLGAVCSDCPAGKLMRACNSLCCSGFTSACYGAAEKILFQCQLELDETVLRSRKKVLAMKRLLTEPLSESLNHFGYERSEGWG